LKRTFLVSKSLNALDIRDRAPAGYAPADMPAPASVRAGPHKLEIATALWVRFQPERSKSLKGKSDADQAHGE
jgi:hypothetical protein